MTTAYVYDTKYLEHGLPGDQHPERPLRLMAIMDTLRQGGALKHMTLLPAVDVADEDLYRVHTEVYTRRIQELCERGGGYIDSDTYVTPATYDVARLAAGGCVAAVDAVLDGRFNNAFALIRPPGHHAFAERAEGFCLFNNAAIAAAHARARGLNRVIIFDFDVHHGNGTQAIFYSDPSVLYISTHQWPLYPGTGHWRETGAGLGRGATINIPFPPGVGDKGLRLAWEAIIGPSIETFHPDLIILSAGFDAHWRDPLAMLQISINGFATLAREAVQLAQRICKGRVVALLEGGYDLDALGYGSLAVARALLGDGQLTDPLGPSSWPEEDCSSLITAIRRLHEW